jgi:hypothetical protein
LEGVRTRNEGRAGQHTTPLCIFSMGRRSSSGFFPAVSAAIPMI